MQKHWLTSILAVTGTLAIAGAAAAQTRPSKQAGDPRAACIRETEKTYPPQTISRKVRDRYVEDCLSKRGGAR